ncbi:MAG TPA: hypothetical protein PLZ93_13745 [Nocardioides sp.]|uniref:hypothetical protein n=1 Tax=uncultured Nocardioides sp. TaxID=198441 RepID=UPI0026112DD1|nr:hypothetical protein [uncultured Nocardioides sp.]HRI96673.1 hypothetical protein [Nocardioides sp.]HRK46517.1 hypothetical protein [Nocardioides sp.]
MDPVSPSWGELFAHGIGGQKDLPIPLELTIAGAVAALTVSFTVLAIAWRTPRYDETNGRPAPPRLVTLVGSRPWFYALRTLGMLAFAYTAMVAVAGEDSLINPLFGIFYVLLWVGFVPVSLLFGPAYKAISPVRTINAGFARLTGSDPERGVFEYPAWLGHWPAAIGLYAFVWMELVYPFATELGPVRLWLAIYVAAMLVGGTLFGNRFYEMGDPFEVFSTLVARMSIWGRRGDELVIRSPLANLANTPVRPGLVAVVAVLFGSTAFDSFKDSIRWVKFIQGDYVQDHDLGLLFGNLGLLSFVLMVAVVFTVGTMLTGVGPEMRRRDLPGQFAHSIVPIVIGYVIAHYLTYLLEVGQQTIIYMSDPFSNGSNWFGTANWTVSYYFSLHPSLLAVIKVLAVVTGHVVGVIAAHDRAIQLLPKKHQLTGQLPLLVVMICFTAGGLYLLFAA